MNTKSTFSRLQVTVVFEPTRWAPATLHRAYAVLVLAPPHRARADGAVDPAVRPAPHH